MSMLLSRHLSKLRDEDKKPKQAPKEPEVREEYPRAIGGGYYELSNGEKVQGKKKAQDAQKELR